MLTRPTGSQRRLTREEAARELLRRRRARTSLVDYALSIEIPGAPLSEDPDEHLFQPIETTVAAHHLLILREIQACMERAYGRLMLFFPPGSAKSTYATVVGPTWALGRWPGSRIIATSYGLDIIRRHSRRARQIVRSPQYRMLWGNEPVMLSAESSSATEWALTNGSDFYAAGLLGGITGNRAHGAIIDDPIAGRQEADSDTIRSSTRQAYEDDLEYRLIPGGWLILMMTRWHEDDLAGGILPEDWAGESGDIECRDGRTWRVICCPAEADRDDDPLGRSPGEMLWPEWFDEQYWESARRRARTWFSLFQQKPRPPTGGEFEREWFPRFRSSKRPKQLRIYGAGDWAVTERHQKKTKSEDPDRTELGIFGLDENNELWILDWWWGEVRTDESVWAFLDLVHRWKPVMWWDEGGVIDKAIRPLLETAMRHGIPHPPKGRRKLAPAYVSLESLPSVQDKKAKVASFRGRSQQGVVHVPLDLYDNHDENIGERVLHQLTGFLAGGRYDDAVDVCGLIGRGLDDMMAPQRRPRAGKRGVKPFTEEWLEADAREELQRRRTRYS